MELFPLYQYLLIGLALLAHYPIGLWVLRARFFTASLVGVSLSALVVGTLANRCAALIRPYLLTVCIFGLVLLARKLIRSKKSWAQVAQAWPLVLLGLLLFWINEPFKTHFVAGAAEPELIYNGHYSYIASQSIEMLNADYWSRLRLLDFYPHEWARYHFFHGATQAVGQAFISAPGLFTYFMVQVLLSIFMILSFAEFFFYRLSGRSYRRLGVLFLIGALGFTVFKNSITFSLFGSAAFALFAFLQFSLSLFSRRPLRAMIFAGIFGASAFRCMPVALVMIFGVAFFYGLFTKRWRWLSGVVRGRVSLMVFIALFGAYNLVTYFFPGSDKEFFTRWIFMDDWQYPLTSYKLIGYFLHPLMDKIGSDRFGQFNLGGILDPVMPQGSILSWVFRTYCAVFSFLFFRGLFLHLKWKRFLMGAATVLGVLGLSLLGSKNLFSLHLMVLPYFLVLYWGYLELGSRFRRVFQILFLVNLATLFYQYTGADEIPSPVAYAVFDLGLWAFAAFVIYRLASRSGIQVRLVCSVLLLLLFVEPGWQGFEKASSFDRTTKPIKISEILKSDFDRDRWVDSRRQGRFEFDDIVKRDVFSTILGARIDLGADEPKDIVNWRFVKR